MDKYDLAIEKLMGVPDEEFATAVENAWAWNHRDGPATHLPLFDSAGRTGDRYDKDWTGEICGCLTQVAEGFKGAATPELTEAIRADKRLPKHVSHIRREHLPVFAQWQRRLDQELNRGA